MNSKHIKIAGWGLSILVALFLIGFSAMGKFTEWDGKEDMFLELGWTVNLMYFVGILEVGITLLFLLPGAGFLGALLLTAYLGGATATHIRVGDDFYFPVIVGVVVWIAYGLRQPEVIRAAFGVGRKKSSPAQPSADDTTD